jgi:hypothetical protein
MHDHRNESYVGIIKFLETSNLKNNIKIIKSLHKIYFNVKVQQPMLI